MLFTLGSDDETMFCDTGMFRFVKFTENIELPAI